jgi:malate synthase
MEDMATGEIRLSILWEWLHKTAVLTAADEGTGAKEGDPFTAEMFSRLLAEEYAKLQRAGNVDVHDDSKGTTLPVAKVVVDAYVRFEQKAPWMVDLLNINLGVEQEQSAEQRTRDFLRLFATEGIRITKNVDFSGGG